MNDRGPGNVSFRLLAIAVVLFFSARSTGAIEGAGRQAVATALDEAQVEQTLSELHDRYRGLDDGEVYRSGSEPVDPDLFGIAVTTVDGQAYEVGDANVPFPIQSVAKPFVFGLALADHGPEIMLEKVGVNATGLPYNSIIASNVRAQSLQNPMVSAGALATASLVKGSTEEEKWDRVRLTFAHYAGHELPFNEAVYRAEMKNSAMTEALADLLSAYDLLYAGVDNTVARYLKSTSQNVTAKDLAVMGATLANWGTNPLTQERAVEARYVQNILSVMITAGFYDDSGEWLFNVGVPGKSGVAGGIVVVVPGRFSIAVYSPPLDSSGNSVRGVKVMEELSKRWNLHLFAP